jgi:putative phosphoesterase
MKLGLISDIHADLKSLKLALDILQGQKVEQIICAGDLVDKGVGGDAVVKLIRERNISCVVGNHDWLADKDQNWLQRNYGDSHPMLLSDETLEYLSTLRDTLNFAWEGQRILVAHGTPWNRDEYLYPYSQPSLFAQVATFAEAEAVILGHTHEPMIADVRGVWIFNPGSVCGIQAEGSGTCATLTLPEYSFRVFSIRTAERIQPEYVEIA